jgi:hypothetical protein
MLRLLPGVKFRIGIPHRFWLGLAHHHLQKNRLDTVILIAVNDAGRARDTIPGSELEIPEEIYKLGRQLGRDGTLKANQDSPMFIAAWDSEVFDTSPVPQKSCA